MFCHMKQFGFAISDLLQFVSKHEERVLGFPPMLGLQFLLWLRSCKILMTEPVVSVVLPLYLFGGLFTGFLPILVAHLPHQSNSQSISIMSASACLQVPNPMLVLIAAERGDIQKSSARRTVIDCKLVGRRRKDITRLNEFVFS